MSVIWSFGQVFPDYFHNPGSGIEAGAVSNTRFYQPDEIKYHGSRNRGATSINFFDVDSSTDEVCRGGFSTGCDAQGQSCDYRATWEVRGAVVDFSVTARQVQDGRTEWVALGFSDNRMMVSGCTCLCTHSRYFQVSVILGFVITPRACARGKAIGLYVCCCCSCRRHENRQISSSRRLCVL